MGGKKCWSSLLNWQKIAIRAEIFNQIEKGDKKQEGALFALMGHKKKLKLHHALGSWVRHRYWSDSHYQGQIVFVEAYLANLLDWPKKKQLSVVSSNPTRWSVSIFCSWFSKEMIYLTFDSLEKSFIINMNLQIKSLSSMIKIITVIDYRRV